MISNETRGFTLIELMLVIAIIGTLAGIATPNYISYRHKAKVVAAIVLIKYIERELIICQVDRGILPVNLGQIGLGSLLDPWGRPFQYLNHATVRGMGSKRKFRSFVPVNTDYDLYSQGVDGRSASAFTSDKSKDDIVRANNGQYIGLVSNY